MKKYLYIFKLYLSVGLEYRGTLFLWILVELASFATVFFFWYAVYKSNSSVGSYQFNDMIYYYAIAPIIWGITSIFISESLPFKIKDGQISSQILKPFSLSFSFFLQALGTKIIQYSMKLPIYILLFVIITSVLKIQVEFFLVLLALVVAFFGLVLHYFLDLTISYISFWIEDTWSLNLVKTILISVFGGMAFPLDLVPAKFFLIFYYLPFKFVYFFPIQVAQGRLSSMELYKGLALLLFWCILLYFVSKLMWKRGLKKYGAYGN